MNTYENPSQNEIQSTKKEGNNLDIENFKDEIKNLENLEGLVSFLERAQIFIFNKNNGIDHGEHIIKQIELAEKIKYTKIITEEYGIRKKVESLFQKDGLEFNNESFNIQEYKKYFKEKYHQYDFTDEEIEMITEKLPPPVFVSVDKGVEGIIVLLNSIDGIETKASCAGHVDDSQENGDHLQRSYISLKETDDVLIRKIQEIILEENYRFDIYEFGNGISFHFIQYPPELWIQEHKKRSKKQVIEDSTKEVEKLLNIRLEIPYDYDNNFPEYYKNFITDVYKILDERKAGGIINKDEYTKLSTKVHNLSPWVQLRNEYKEFYISPLAQERLDKYHSDFEGKIISYKRDLKLNEEVELRQEKEKMKEFGDKTPEELIDEEIRRQKEQDSHNEVDLGLMEDYINQLHEQGYISKRRAKKLIMKNT